MGWKLSKFENGCDIDIRNALNNGSELVSTRGWCTNNLARLRWALLKNESYTKTLLCVEVSFEIVMQ